MHLPTIDNTDREDRAKELLDDMVKSHIHRHGQITTSSDATGRLLLERYRGTLREFGYPVRRLEEMYGYPEALSEVQQRGHPVASGSADVPQGDNNGGNENEGEQ